MQTINRFLDFANELIAKYHGFGEAYGPVALIYPEEEQMQEPEAVRAQQTYVTNLYHIQNLREENYLYTKNLTFVTNLLENRIYQKLYPTVEKQVEKIIREEFPKAEKHTVENFTKLIQRFVEREGTEKISLLKEALFKEQYKTEVKLQKEQEILFRKLENVYESSNYRYITDNSSKQYLSSQKIQMMQENFSDHTHQNFTEQINLNRKEGHQFLSKTEILNNWTQILMHHEIHHETMRLMKKQMHTVQGKKLQTEYSKKIFEQTSRLISERTVDIPQIIQNSAIQLVQQVHQHSVSNKNQKNLYREEAPVLNYYQEGDDNDFRELQYQETHNQQQMIRQQNQTIENQSNLIENMQSRYYEHHTENRQSVQNLHYDRNDDNRKISYHENTSVLNYYREGDEDHIQETQLQEIHNRNQVIESQEQRIENQSHIIEKHEQKILHQNQQIQQQNQTIENLQHAQSVQNAEYQHIVQKLHKIEPQQNVQNVQNAEYHYNIREVQNIGPQQNVQNVQNTEHRYNIQTTQNTEHRNNIQAEENTEYQHHIQTVQNRSIIQQQNPENYQSVQNLYYEQNTDNGTVHYHQDAAVLNYYQEGDETQLQEIQLQEIRNRNQVIENQEQTIENQNHIIEQYEQIIENQNQQNIEKAEGVRYQKTIQEIQNITHQQNVQEIENIAHLHNIQTVANIENLQKIQQQSRSIIQQQNAENYQSVQNLYYEQNTDNGTVNYHQDTAVLNYHQEGDETHIQEMHAEEVRNHRQMIENRNRIIEQQDQMIEKLQNIQNIQNTQNIQNIQTVQNIQNILNAPNIQNVNQQQKIQKLQNIDTGQQQNTENYQSMQNVYYQQSPKSRILNYHELRLHYPLEAAVESRSELSKQFYQTIIQNYQTDNVAKIVREGGRTVLQIKQSKAPQLTMAMPLSMIYNDETAPEREQQKEMLKLQKQVDEVVKDLKTVEEKTIVRKKEVTEQQKEIVKEILKSDSALWLEGSGQDAIRKEIQKNIEQGMPENIDRITAKVYRRLEEKLKMERGRRGMN